MNFAHNAQVAANTDATELSQERMVQYFAAASNLGVMNENGFEK